MNGLKAESLAKSLRPAIQKRVKELAAISPMITGADDPSSRGAGECFMFMADLGAGVGRSRVCQFIKPKYSKQAGNHAAEIMEIFFSTSRISAPAVLLVEGLVHSGVTSEFLMNDLRAGGGYGEVGDAVGPPVAAAWPCSLIILVFWSMRPFS